MVPEHGEHSVVTLNRHNKTKFVSTAQEGHPGETQQLPPHFYVSCASCVFYVLFGTLLKLLLTISLVVNRNVFSSIHNIALCTYTLKKPLHRAVLTLLTH